MKKSKLLEMPPLRATKTMVRSTTPMKKTFFGISHTSYQHKRYLRCCVQDGIFKISIFFPEPMRTGGRQSSYDIYFSKEEQTFRTFDRVKNRWLTGKLDTLEWPEYGSYSGDEWITPADDALIRQYFGGIRGGFYDALDFQRQVRANELKCRHKKETDPWDADLAQVPALPKDWERWVCKVGIPENYIYYQYSKKGATQGYCTYCEKDVPIKAPRHNKAGHCTRCRRPITFKSIGRAGYVETSRYSMCILQACKDGFVFREFEGKRWYNKGEFMSPRHFCFERRRVIYNSTCTSVRTYYWGLYKQIKHRWLACSVYSGSNWMDCQSRIYGKTLPHLAKTALRQTGLMEAMNGANIYDVERYLGVRHKFPPIEQLVKASLCGLSDEIITRFSSAHRKLLAESESSLTKMLRLDKPALRRLKVNEGGQAFLEWLQYERTSASAIPDHVIHWLISENFTPETVRFITNRMTVMQIYNYLRKQMEINQASCKDILIKWKDYLSMAERLGIDTSDEIIFKVNKLYQRHDALLRRCNEEDEAQQAREVSAKFPTLDNIYQSLQGKYTYMSETYCVLVPTGVADILHEGRSLSHCVSSSSSYWERAERKESFILFLRRTSEPDLPYYTLEVEPNGTVRQERAKYDRQNKEDIHLIKEFLVEWQQSIRKRLSTKDHQLAKKSRVLRLEEFAELQENQVLIHTGDLQGQLLVDVLTADLLEATAA